MAHFKDFPERNDFMGKPETLSNNQCNALPICRILTFIPGVIDRAPAQQVHAHVSFWEFSDEELAEVIKNKGVWLKVLGTSTFPLLVEGIKPIYPGDGNLADYVFTKEEVEGMKRDPYN